MIKRVAHVALMMVTVMSVQPSHAKQFDSSTLVSETLAALPDCLDYCLEGVAIRMRITLSGLRFDLSPLIGHNLADVLVMAHGNTDKGPWSEWSSAFDKAQVKITAPLAQAWGADNTDGGQLRGVGYGHHHTHAAMDAQVIGHPMALIPRLLNNRGQVRGDRGGSCSTPGCLENSDIGAGISNDPRLLPEDQEPSWLGDPIAAAEDYLGDYTDKVSNCAQDVNCALSVVIQDDSLLNILSIYETIQTIAQGIQIFQQVKQIVTVLDAIATAVTVYTQAFGVSVGVRMRRVVCPTKVVPFTPYYLSSMDWLFWRSGWPITDIDDTLTILNPLSQDVLKVPTPNSPLDEKIGHIFPRQGVVDHPLDTHRAALIAKRAGSILSDDSNYHIRLNLPPQKGGQWQRLHPTGSSCKNYPEPSKSEDEDGYAWSYWRRYECDTNWSGKLILTLKLPPVCIF